MSDDNKMPNSSEATRPTFEEAWAKKVAQGYQYGRDALEGVRFGWEIALEATAPERVRAEVIEEVLAVLRAESGAADDVYGHVDTCIRAVEKLLPASTSATKEGT
jgi:hypothetical protein